MTNEPDNYDSESQDEWNTYLQVFLDESDEHIESLMQALLRLESDPHDSESLNEAFRLLHTHKSSAGLMGFDGISEFAHELENRFEQYRSGAATLDPPRTSILLRCVDFLRNFNAALRADRTPDQDGTSLLRQLEELEELEASGDAAPADDKQPPGLPAALRSLHGGYRIRIEFQEGLQLADMKARLIVARLSNVGEIIATEPPVEDTHSFDDLSQFVLIVLTDRDPAEVQRIANVDGVKSVQIEGGAPESSTSRETVTDSGKSAAALAATEVDADGERGKPSPEGEEKLAAGMSDDAELPESSRGSDAELAQDQELPATPSPESAPERAAVAETVRVGIDRLDKLMNLTGELIVTRARLVEITGDMDTVLRAKGKARQTHDMGEKVRAGVLKVKELLESRHEMGDNSREMLRNLEADLKSIEGEFEAWEQGRRHFSRIADAVDQLNRVSGNLQQSVLDTRMVPVAPLFNRFRRVIRDLANERKKHVQLEIHGAKTELDKRMIDELGDPLLHLIRNSLDHGLELPDERKRQGKPETGTIVLEASHRGNNVFITVSDDGAGLNLDRIRERILKQELASENNVSEMSEQQVIDHIWHPGFSTAEKVTEISGRGVGMDVVKSRISELNGSIEIMTSVGQGTSFRLRLPLTLAIIRSLLVRFRSGFFSVPIDDVREIEAVRQSDIYTIQGCETIDVRGELIPLIRMNRVFQWHAEEYRSPNDAARDSAELLNVVILNSAGHSIGLCVDELLGSSDVVIKSLSDNFVNIQGLSGASIRGDGTLCLMLDSSEVIKMTTKPSGSASKLSAT